METKSPLRIVTHDQFCMERVPEPCGIVIFGASGDLAHRKLIPAFYDLYHSGLFPKGFFIVGFGRSAWSDDLFRKEAAGILREKEKGGFPQQKEFLSRLYYQSGEYTDSKGLLSLQQTVKKLHEQYKTKENLIFYFATPPFVYCDLIRQMSKAGLIHPSKKSGPWTRVVFEKPFGNDLNSAKKLNQEIQEVLNENQIYRIDHYLGKETVQNILIFRFMNSIFEPVWNRRYIDHIQITAAENLGVEHRAGYYDEAGALRDMFQNHMMQLLSLVAMEPPVSFDANQYRDEKVKVLRSIRPIPAKKTDEFVIRGQYGSGNVCTQTGTEKVPGYRGEKGVRPNSTTETFAALKLFVDNWRWQGVPFYLRSGKRLKAQSTEIAIQFKNVPHSMFASMGIDQFPPNVLLIRIQPDEGISLSFEAKHPGPKFCMATLNLEFNYEAAFQEKPLGAYERLLLDCMLGDQTLFVRQDMVEESWALLSDILEHWKKSTPPDFPNYEAGSWGPLSAHELIKRDGRTWHES